MNSVENKQSPQRLYGLNDMIKADCMGCQGCFNCCQGMGTSIILDPWDIFCITKYLGKTFEELLQKELELNIVNGAILPNLKMSGVQATCPFLKEGRCSIHKHRPGICRLFPIGRQYEEGKLFYFIVNGECKNLNRSKIKVKKWLGIPDVARNQQFVTDWHYFKKHVETYMMKELKDEERKNVQMFLLQQFFLKPYDETGDFYQEFSDRLTEAKEVWQFLM